MADALDKDQRELEDILRDHTIVVPQDADVWALIGQHVYTEPVHSNTPPCACRRCRETP
jgi:hypothetical protein